MDTASAELSELMAKESWTQQDCQHLIQLFFQITQPGQKFRQQVEKLAVAEPEPTGAAAVKLGIANYMLCRFDKALDLLTKGTDNKERRFYQAACHKILRQWDKALENLEYAEDRGWDAHRVTVEKAEVQCLSGQTDTAARTIERFAKSSQEDPDWHYVVGMIAELGGEYGSALESYETARRLSASHPRATFRLAYYYDLHGDEEAAMQLYRECIAQTEAAEGALAPDPRPIYANALLNLAVLYEDAGRYDEAERALQRILAAHPNHVRARLFLKDVIASKTMYFDEDEAKRLARRNDLLGIPVTDFELSVRARNCLKKMNIRTLGDLLHVTEPELLSYKNFGETSLAEIKSMLATKSLRLGQLREETAETASQDHGPAVGNEGVLATPISQIEFSVRARSALERLNVKTLGELASKTEPELLACRNFGQTSLGEIHQRLAEYGFRLREAT